MNFGDIRQQNADANTRKADQGDARVQLAQQAIAVREQELGRQLKNDERKAIIDYFKANRDFMGKPGITLPQAETAVQGIGGGSAPATPASPPKLPPIDQFGLPP
jgi:hypothetical protein